MTTALPCKPLEVTLFGAYGARVVRVASIADVDKHLTECVVARNLARHPAYRQTRELRLAILLLACDQLLDARLVLAEQEMTAVVDAWLPMPDFRRLGRQVSSEEVAA